MKKFHKHCIKGHDGLQVTNLTSCSREAMDDTDVSQDAIAKCVSTSFDGPDPLYNDSAILRAQRDAFEHV
jgi:hypothetical protein